MENQMLDVLIARYKASELPRPPTDLHPSVWREIRLRQYSPVTSNIGYDGFLYWVRGSMPMLIAPMLALSMVISVALTSFSNNSNQHRRVEEALGLKVFSHPSSTLTRVAQNP